MDVQPEFFGEVFHISLLSVPSLAMTSTKKWEVMGNRETVRLAQLASYSSPFSMFFARRQMGEFMGPRCKFAFSSERGKAERNTGGTFMRQKPGE